MFKQLGDNIIIENDYCKLTVDSNCRASSLIFKQTGEECLNTEEDTALFSMTQERPYNNEVKLAHMNKITTYQANRIVRVDGDKLHIKFEEVPYEVVVSVNITPAYITFTLEEMIVYPSDERTLKMDKPAVFSFRLIQLPMKHRKNFGEWLNTVSDDAVSIAVVATSPYELVDSEKRKSMRILYAEARKDVRLVGAKAALIGCPSDAFMDVMDTLEEDFDLPRGVKSRRDPRINASLLRVPFITPENVDEYIGYAQKAGLKNMLIYYTAMFDEAYIYELCGDYDYRASYPNKQADVKLVLDKLKAAGITPGLHFLHTHIGMKSRYVTPVPDRRLNLKMHYTLSKPLDADSDVIYVDESPEYAPKHELCRILRFGNELIKYDSFSTERPYRFEGCVRGYNGTMAEKHPAGCIGGILDVSEFGGVSVYLDQNSDLQDEVSKKIADAYNQGFEFAYFDGSEGTNAPFAYHVPNAQYRMYKQMKPAPVFCEGAAKAHFSWHMITGGNAFDMFPNDIFKDMIVEFPFREAEMMLADHTRVNFGWWALNNETQPDMYEFGMSRAAAWNCPTTVNAGLGTAFKENPRIDDVLEVVRRWEDVRTSGWLTEEQKQQLRDPKQEYILLINEKGEYELVPYEQINCTSSDVSAFYFSRNDRSYVVCWHKRGAGKLSLKLDASVKYEAELGSECDLCTVSGDQIKIEVAGRRYLSTEAPKEVIISAFENAVLE